MNDDTLPVLVCGALFVLAVAATILYSRIKAQKIIPLKGKNSSDPFDRLTGEARARPEDPEARIALGRAVAVKASQANSPDRRLQGYREAAEHFRIATEIAPAHPGAWKNLGQAMYLLLRLGAYDNVIVQSGAHTAYETAVSLAPEDASLWHHWAEDLYMAAAYCPDMDKKRTLAEQAKSCFARAVALRPELMREWSAWGGSEADSGRIEAAASALDNRGPWSRDQAEAGEEENISGEEAGVDAPEQGLMPWEVDSNEPEAAIPLQKLPGANQSASADEPNAKKENNASGAN